MKLIFQTFFEQIIESDSENILELECEMSTVHSYLSKLPKSLILEEAEEVISRAYVLYQKHPPSLLQKEAIEVVGQRYVIKESEVAKSFHSDGNDLFSLKLNQFSIILKVRMFSAQNSFEFCLSLLCF